VASVAQQNLTGRFERRSLRDAVAGFAKSGTLRRQHPIAPVDRQDLHVVSCQRRAAPQDQLCN